MKDPKTQLRDSIDDYKDTIFAILAFLNLYRFDDEARTMRPDVKVFQGRRLKPEDGDAVTPDLGVVDTGRGTAVLGEVKKSFPGDASRWIDDFRQLQSYDMPLRGWPTESGRMESHDIVLLLHLTRAAAVNRYYQERKGGEISFTRPFAIVEFSRSDQRQSYVFLRTVDGAITCQKTKARLADGISVPMSALLTEYSAIKLYDAEPPLPYMMELIWTNVVAFSASEDQRFATLRKNQKLDVSLQIEKIVQRLHEYFSFRGLSGENREHEPQVPKQAWVMNACKKFTACGDAIWDDQPSGRLIFKFRKYDDVLLHFVEACVDDEMAKNQMNLPGFPER